jgi:hypothetical protein
LRNRRGGLVRRREGRPMLWTILVVLVVVVLVIVLVRALR